MEHRQSRQGPVGHHGPGAMMPGEKAKDFKGAMKRLIAAYLAKSMPAMIFLLLCSAASTVFFIFGPRILGGATTELFEGFAAMLAGTGEIRFDVIANILLLLAVLYGISALLSYVQGWVMSGMAAKLGYQMRRDLSAKIDRLELSYFDSVSHGEVLSRISNDVDTITQTINQSLSQIVSNVTLVVGVLAMMFAISPLMAVVALCVVPMSLGIVIAVVKKSQPFFQRQQSLLGKVNGHVEEMYGGHTVVSVFCGEQASIQQFEQLNEQLYTAAWKSQFLSGMMMPMMNFAGNLGYVGICILGGLLSLRQAITVGDIQAFIQYVRQFTQPLNQIANISNVMQQTAAAAERVFAFLEQAEETDVSNSGLCAQQAKGKVCFQDVRFGYVPEKTIIHHFSITVQPGQRVAIVGPTGAGKTTVVKLLMRFYDVTGGAVLLDDIDVRKFERKELRRALGMVLQDTWLYHGTIRENIRYGRLSATDEEVEQAARAAQADHFIRTLPEGYDTLLNEEATNISQGQKQLLTIARAMLSRPRILILDEATSSVDTRTELAIQTAMERLTYGRTSFIIAHRLSTIRNADMILVMKDGDIIETGSHDELLKQQGFYAELYRSQFAGSQA